MEKKTNINTANNFKLGTGAQLSPYTVRLSSGTELLTHNKCWSKTNCFACPLRTHIMVSLLPNNNWEELHLMTWKTRYSIKYLWTLLEDTVFEEYSACFFLHSN